MMAKMNDLGAAFCENSLLEPIISNNLLESIISQ